MLIVNKSQVILSDDGEKLLAEASTLGLKPGEWPDFIGVVNDADTGFVFGPAYEEDLSNGELASRTYYSNQGFKLVVFND